MLFDMTGPSADNLHAIGALTRSTAHDLNNYMATIMSFAQLVLEALPDQHPLRGEVQGILCTGHRVILTTRELSQLVGALAPAGHRS